MIQYLSQGQRSGQQVLQHFSLMSMKGYSHLANNGVLLTRFPRLGIIFFLESSVRFYDGSDFQQICRTENDISTISIRDKLLAIGQKMFKGQLTTTTIINLETKEISKFKFQKTIIQHLSLSCDGKYLCAVGSSDGIRQQLNILDATLQLQIGCKIITNQINTKKDDVIVGIEFSKNNPNLLAILYTNRLVLGKIEDQILMKTVSKTNKVRQFAMMQFDPHDACCFLCSKNGDISQINMKTMKEVRVGPRKRVIISGIKHIRYISGQRIIITGVKGFIALIDLKDLKILKQVTLNDQIISLTEFQEALGFVATDKAAIFILNADNLSITPFYFCNNAKVNQIKFFSGFSQVFATCSGSQIMIWKIYNIDPILKIRLPGKTCLCLHLTHDGKTIISGWSDDCIRFFSPVTGKEINKINNAHCGKVNILTGNTMCDRLISGGDNGSIRIWKISKQKFGLIDNILSGHRSQVNYLQIVGSQLYSCGEDGTFAVWDLHKGDKLLMVQTNNYLKKVLYFDKFHVLAIGSGPQMHMIRKNDGVIIKSLHVGGSHLNDFEIINTVKADYIIFGGEQKEIIIYKLGEGIMNLKVGVSIERHPTYGQVTSVAVSPDEDSLIASTKEGYIVRFKFDSQGYCHHIIKQLLDPIERKDSYFS